MKLKMPPNCVLVPPERGTVITLIPAEVFRKQQIAAQKANLSTADKSTFERPTLPPDFTEKKNEGEG